jgi:hypothetical protein
LGECHRIDWVVYAKRPAAIPTVSPSLTDGWASFRATLNTIDSDGYRAITMRTFTYCLSRKASGCHAMERKMPKETHTKAAEHDENAAKAHRIAAEHHGRGEHDKGQEESSKAHGHSIEAHRHSTDAHGKSGEHRTKK